jgi:hypothetical protein
MLSLPRHTVTTAVASCFAFVFTYTDILSVLVMAPLRNRLRSFLPLTKLTSYLVSARWTSNIPGQAGAMDELSTCISGPFPTLVDYNSCMPALQLPVILSGKAPQGARYWSVQIYLT